MSTPAPQRPEEATSRASALLGAALAGLRAEYDRLPAMRTGNHRYDHRAELERRALFAAICDLRSTKLVLVAKAQVIAASCTPFPHKKAPGSNQGQNQ